MACHVSPPLRQWVLDGIQEGGQGCPHGTNTSISNWTPRATWLVSVFPAENVSPRRVRSVLVFLPTVPLLLTRWNFIHICWINKPKGPCLYDPDRFPWTLGNSGPSWEIQGSDLTHVKLRRRGWMPWSPIARAVWNSFSCEGQLYADYKLLYKKLAPNLVAD